MHRLQEIVNKSARLVVGLISGTSVDGVDAALVRIKNQGKQTEIELLSFLSLPYPDEVLERVIKCSRPGQGSVDEICRLNAVVGEIFAEAATRVIKQAHLALNEVDLIGSHGQTIHHLPNVETIGGYDIRATLQIGEPSLIAKRTGIVTVADFRPADMALGGEGAPLVPYFDYLMLRDAERSRAVLNIGGIGNLTILKKNCEIDQVVAFDTGPGNMVIDSLMLELFQKPFDQNGNVARSGRVSKKLLSLCLAQPFFHKPPPKSTGREEFGREFADELLKRADQLKVARQDIIATATELTAVSIWEAYSRFVADETPIQELIVGGGGTENSCLMDLLRAKFTGVRVDSIDRFGIPSEAKEAICFAVLANETLAGNPNNVPSATGAAAATVLGKVCF